MQKKVWLLLAVCVLCAILTFEFYDVSISYHNIILPKGMDTFPFSLFNFTVDSAATSQELSGYANTFKWLSLLPLSFALLSYWKLMKLVK